VKEWLEANNLPGRVRYYGCPAEEGGAAKGFMVREGAFDDVDIAISWHPACFSGVNEPVSLANTRIDFSFTGRAAHAASGPHLGRSALDAVELMNAGGIAPNVVQSHAKVRYLIRARNLAELNGLVARVRKIADGAALMTETTVSTQVISAVSNLLGNTALEEAMHANFQRLGPPQFTEEDRAFAAEIQKTLREEDILSAYRRQGVEPEAGKSLCDLVVPLGAKGAGMVGSTDVGDVSWKVPTVQARGATYAIGTPGHSWQVVAQGRMPAAHTGMVHVAKVMAGTAVDAIRNPALVEAAKADHHVRTGGKPYESPLPPDARPALGMSLAE
jgi:aminobenzoyl-glutamate utilization protein B